MSNVERIGGRERERERETLLLILFSTSTLPSHRWLWWWWCCCCCDNYWMGMIERDRGMEIKLIYWSESIFLTPTLLFFISTNLVSPYSSNLPTRQSCSLVPILDQSHTRRRKKIDYQLFLTVYWAVGKCWLTLTRPKPQQRQSHIFNCYQRVA